MRGIILAGGKGTRLWPLTLVTNKHLVPVGNLPMIEYPLYTLKNLNLETISIITGGEHFKDISSYLSIHDMDFSYHYQKEAGGIAQALSIPEKFLNDKNEKIAVILGDNIFEDNFYNDAREFERSSYDAMLFLKEVQDPERFGVVTIKDNKIISIDEKPKEPKSNLIITGLYFYDSGVFDKIRKLKPSLRGELEITDINNMYIEEGNLTYRIIKGFWSDAGVIKSRHICEDFVKNNLEKKVIKTFNQYIIDKLPGELLLYNDYKTL